MGTFEEEYEFVLIAIETSITSVYYTNDEMSDWEAKNAVNGLIRTYNAELRRRKSPQLNLDQLETVVYEKAKMVCDFYLGREAVENKDGEEFKLEDDAYTVKEIVDCLKRIRKSIELWQKEGGNRGYFNFVKSFLPIAEPDHDEE